MLLNNIYSPRYVTLIVIRFYLFASVFVIIIQDCVLCKNGKKNVNKIGNEIFCYLRTTEREREIIRTGSSLMNGEYAGPGGPGFPGCP